MFIMAWPAMAESAGMVPSSGSGGAENAELVNAAKPMATAKIAAKTKTSSGEDFEFFTDICLCASSEKPRERMANILSDGCARSKLEEKARANEKRNFGIYSYVVRRKA